MSPMRLPPPLRPPLPCRPLVLAVLGAIALALASCGGGGSASSGSAGTTGGPTGSNVVALMVDGGPAAARGTVNQAYVTITVCIPNTTTCQTIDHVWVDTGSSGLRLVATSVTVALPLATLNGLALASCGQFVSSYIWGAVRTADVQIGTKKVGSVPIQMIADTGDMNDPIPASAPANCSNGATLQSTVANLGANGLLGIGMTKQDCGPGCASTPAPTGWYYNCPLNSCAAVSVPTVQQLQNVVALFASDNNGVLIQLPAVPSGGQTSATGLLIFGIGTQANNGLGSATVFPVDPNPSNATYLDLATTFAGTSYPQSFVDSGSNGWFFADPNLTPCSGAQAGFFCQNAGPLSATLLGAAGSPSFAYGFSISDASKLNGNFAAFSGLGGPSGSTVSFDWGLPFFYGRSVFTALEGTNISGNAGPFIAASTP